MEHAIHHNGDNDTVVRLAPKIIVEAAIAKAFSARRAMENRYEPCSRFWHSAVFAEGLVHIRGGSTANFNSERNFRQQLAKIIEQFDPINDIWRQLTTKGAPHPGLSAVACASFGGYLYAFGGFDGEQLHSTLSRLELKTLTWSKLSAVAEDGPIRKDASGMVHFNSDKLAVIGGYGCPGDGPIQPGSLFIPNERFTDGTGWTNEIHIFDICTGSWSSPLIKGTRPPPCADFTLTSIDSYRAVLYGGCRPPEGKCLDKDLHLINFNSMEILRIEAKQGELWPVVTIGHHAACCLGFNTEHPQLLVSGGRNCNDKSLRDIWKFDLALKRWEHILLPVKTLLPRWGHSATTVVLSDGTEEVLLFGGASADYQYSWSEFGSKNLPRLTEPRVIFFGSAVHAVKSCGQLGILRQNMDLTQYVIEGKLTGRQLGKGYYGSVEEIIVKGLLCAAKKIKPSTELNTYDVLKECRLISSLHHPNIVQFIGICLHPSSQLPILVMEKLKSHLYEVLIACPTIPLILKYSILRDIARGLAYLHPQVIHRDLSAKNVLLTPFFSAKICDFGNSLSSDLNGRLQRLTPYPGKRVYMPPEALIEPFIYDCSMDIFSFGHLALFTMIQIFPGDLEPSHSCNSCITEVERRGKYFKQLEHKSQYCELIQLTKDCLHNHAPSRPTAEQILCSLEGMKDNSDNTCEIMDAVKQVAY